MLPLEHHKKAFAELCETKTDLDTQYLTKRMTLTELFELKQKIDQILVNNNLRQENEYPRSPTHPRAVDQEHPDSDDSISD